MRKSLLTMIMFVVLTFGSTLAQDAGKKDEVKIVDAKPVVVEAKPEVKALPEIKDVFLIINLDNISQILVVSIDGRWVPEAREAIVTTKIGGAKPTVKCTMYAGVFKPTTARIKTWSVASIVAADQVQFQSILDALEDGKFELPK